MHFFFRSFADDAVADGCCNVFTQQAKMYLATDVISHRLRS